MRRSIARRASGDTRCASGWRPSPPCVPCAVRSRSSIFIASFPNGSLAWRWLTPDEREADHASTSGYERAYPTEDIVKSAEPIASALLSAVIWLAAFAVEAQTYPSKPIRAIVPYSVGTPPDIVTRLVADRMTAGLGQPVVVENRPGATGTVGLSEFARQPADG